MPQPMVLGLWCDGIRRVAHAQPRMTASVRVRRGAAPVLHEEQPAALLGRAEVVLWIDRPQVGVFGDAPIEGGHDPGDRLLAADLVEERGGHADILGHDSAASAWASAATAASGSPGVRFITYDVG